MAFAILVIALFSLKSNPLILFTLMMALVNGIITFHGDAMEITRHFFTADVSLKIAFLLALIRLLDVLLNHSRQKRAQAIDYKRD